MSHQTVRLVILDLQFRKLGNKRIPETWIHPYIQYWVMIHPKYGFMMVYVDFPVMIHPYC